MTSDNKDSLIDYKQAGVDVDAGYDLVKKLNLLWDKIWIQGFFG